MFLITTLSGCTIGNADNTLSEENSKIKEKWELSSRAIIEFYELSLNQVVEEDENGNLTIISKEETSLIEKNIDLIILNNIKEYLLSLDFYKSSRPVKDITLSEEDYKINFYSDEKEILYLIQESGKLYACLTELSNDCYETDINANKYRNILYADLDRKEVIINE